MDGLVPLTFGQKWVLETSRYGAAYSKPVQRVFEVDKDVDVSRLAIAFECLQQVHPALRLELESGGGAEYQFFPLRKVAIECLEVTGRDSSLRRAVTERLIRKHAEVDLCLSGRNPVSAKLFRLDDIYLLSLCVDHLAADAISLGNIRHQISDIYFDLSEGLADFKECSSFRDYAFWEQRFAAIQGKCVDYWDSRYSTVDSAASFRDVDRWCTADSIQWKIDALTFRRIIEKAKSLKATAFNCLVAAMLLAMQESIDETDLVINIPVSNRAYRQHFSIVGNLSILLPFRFKWDGAMPIHDLVGYVRNEMFIGMQNRFFDYGVLSTRICEQLSKFPRAGANFVSNETILRAKDILKDYCFSQKMSSHVPFQSLYMLFELSGDELEVQLELDANGWQASAHEFMDRFLRNLERITV